MGVPLGPNLLGSCTSGCPRQILGASFLPADSGVTREVCDVQDFLGPWQAYSHAQSSLPWAIADSEQGLLNIACRQKCTLISWNLVGFTFARSRKSRRHLRWSPPHFLNLFAWCPCPFYFRFSILSLQQVQVFSCGSRSLSRTIISILDWCRLVKFFLPWYLLNFLSNCKIFFEVFVTIVDQYLSILSNGCI